MLRRHGAARVWKEGLHLGEWACWAKVKSSSMGTTHSGWNKAQVTLRMGNGQRKKWAVSGTPHHGRKRPLRRHIKVFDKGISASNTYPYSGTKGGNCCFAPATCLSNHDETSNCCYASLEAWMVTLQADSRYYWTITSVCNALSHLRWLQGMQPKDADHIILRQPSLANTSLRKQTQACARAHTHTYLKLPHLCICVYIYIYAVELLSWPSWPIWGVIIWAKFVILKTLFVKNTNNGGFSTLFLKTKVACKKSQGLSSGPSWPLYVATNLAQVITLLGPDNNPSNWY